MTGQQVHPFPLLNVTEQTGTPPVPPVTLAEAKAFIRVDGTDQDDVINAILAAATSWAEGLTRRAFIERPLDVRMGSLPVGACRVVLPFPPVIDLTAITYQDMDGNAQTMDVADVSVDGLFGLVTPNAGVVWPAVRYVDFVYTAGYGPAGEDVPGQIRQAILVASAQMYEYRVDQTVGAQISRPHDKASAALLQDFRVFEL